MKKILFLFLIFLSWPVDASTIALATAPVNIHDTASIKRGAKFFGTVCIACHTMIYMRYDPIAIEAGVTIERMPLKVTKWPNDVKPPDLSLEADVKGADWIYTYLHSFYVDPKTVTGFNNLVNPNTAMPDMLIAYQGPQILVREPNISYRSLEWYDRLELQKQGSMTPEQFDALLVDVVNFLVYAANPHQVYQERLGWWVMGFLIILIILTYLLKKEYWKDIKKE